MSKEKHDNYLFKRKDKKIPLLLSDEMLMDLENESEARGVNRLVFIRQSIAEKLERCEKERSEKKN